ncbi:hypothetical protein AVDCRST_MAG84-4748 [uncultured Microcoleus sp.]|uniref:Uncharacterized protein n=1 Tax=uncultured Microcoleus sp. TaxID=259945 RepID=A0A6J4N6K3_9CYAN|nr:hypothetical protein AVDCRST_MAG84-4748 [uncultured Microcoleus sp.]
MFNFIYRKSIFRNLAQPFTVEHDDFAAAQFNQVACSKFFERLVTAVNRKQNPEKATSFTLASYNQLAQHLAFLLRHNMLWFRD